jgi:superfamily II DNA or RNA helicase
MSKLHAANTKQESRIAAVYSDGIYLHGLTSNQESDLAERLTFDNPAYAKALLYSPYEKVYVPPTLCYAENTSRGLRVPIGTRHKLIDSAQKTDDRIYIPIPFPKFGFSLRTIQQNAADAYLAANKGFDVNSLCVAQTGTGKSLLALYIASRLGQRTLILCHKLDLIDQFREEATRAFSGKLSIGEYHGKKKTQGEHLTLASHQTLSRLDESALEKFLDNYGFVVVDEAHGAVSSCFSTVNKCKARYKLGLTATPERNDGLTHVLYLALSQNEWVGGVSLPRRR